MSNANRSTGDGGLNPKFIATNLIGNGIPLVIALFCIPPLLHKFGPDRFGYISLFWALIGTLSLIDLGLGRAATHYVAKNPSSSGSPTFAADIWALVALTTMLGCFGGGLLFGLGFLYVDTASAGNPAVGLEFRASLPWLAFAVPLTTASAAFRGVLEGELDFLYVNVVRTLTGALGFVGLFFSDLVGNGIEGAAIVLLAARAAMAACYMLPVTIRIRPRFSKSDASGFGSLVRFGGWVTVSNAIGSILVYIDRLLLGAILVPSTFTIYATSFESASRLLFIAGSVSTVLYPITASRGKTASHRAIRSANIILTVFLAIPCLLLVGVANDFLTWWIDAPFAEAATPVFRLICLAVIVNGFAHLPFAVIQGLGRPDITAKLHLVEILPYILVLGLLTIVWGATGAALAWLLRVSADYLLLLHYQRQLLAENKA